MSKSTTITLQMAALLAAGGIIFSVWPDTPLRSREAAPTAGVHSDPGPDELAAEAGLAFNTGPLASGFRAAPLPAAMSETAAAGLHVMAGSLDAAGAEEGGTQAKLEEESSAEPEAEAKVPAEPDDEPGDGAHAQYVAALEQEVIHLREELEHLRESMTFYTESYLAELQLENEILRRLISENLGRGPAAAPSETAQAPAAAPAPGSAPAPGADEMRGDRRMAGSHAYTVVREWGRTPEQAEGLGGQVKSLKGMVGHVPPGLDTEALAALARSLRDEFSTYDNINIHLFNDAGAAEAYAARNQMDERSLVLLISKYEATGYDEVLLFEDARPISVPQY